MPAIQLAHSGRKGSVSRPWEGTQPLTAAEGAWEVICPSPAPFGNRTTALRAMDDAAIAEVIAAFKAATRRAREAGFKILELHAAHGYLINEFLAPRATNAAIVMAARSRTARASCFETIDAIREEWPWTCRCSCGSR